LAALGGFLVAALDDDPSTKPDPIKTIREIKRGVGEIKGAGELDVVPDGAEDPVVNPTGVRSAPLPSEDGDDDDDDEKDVEVAANA